MKINIIDPSSTEFNRGSFCYAPYLCYNGLSEVKHSVTLYETIRPEDLDLVKDADIQLITLWSYPQIESAFLFNHFLPFTYQKNNVYFVGYAPLIKSLGLRHVEEILGYDPLQDSDFLSIAMSTYPKYYSHFKRLLLSDCDMHLKTLEKGHKVHPLFTTYGCPNGCAFCPSTVNCGLQRIQLSTEATVNVLNRCLEQGIKYIHFTDEDFFFNIRRAYDILKGIEGKGFHLIALGSARVVKKFIDKYGWDVLHNAGMEVIEIGFESASETISTSMGAGKSLSDCEDLARIQHKLPFNIFWLVQTFFPGETISTLNETGRFMKKYGFEESEVVGRLRTNGTKGGLGQFFQPYVGVDIFPELRKTGTFLTERPVRLIPSYLPDSFLDSVITSIHMENYAETKPWLDLYNLSDIYIFRDPTQLFVGSTIRSYLEESTESFKTQLAMGFALLARMEVIK